MSDLSHFEEFLTCRTWIFSETIHRSNFLKSEISSRDSSSNNIFSTHIQDGIYCFVRDVFEKNRENLSPAAPLSQVKRLSDWQSSFLLYFLIQENPESFPTLRRRWKGGDYYEVGRSTLHFFDSIRLNDTSEALLRSILDEYGNLLGEKQETEELVLLLELYSRSQREKNMFDGPGLFEIALELLYSAELKKTVEETLPEVLILDNPTHFYPLESLLWRGFAEKCRFVVSGDETLLTGESSEAPSRRSGQSVTRFVTEQKKKIEKTIPLPIFSPGRTSIIKNIFDGERETIKSSSFAGLGVLECHERRGEVLEVAKRIKEGLQEGTAPKEFHIVTLELETYEQQIRDIFQKLQIPISIARGIPLQGTTRGSLLKRLLAWVSHPSVEKMEQLVAHPQFYMGTKCNRDELKIIFSLFRELGLSTQIELSPGWEKPLLRLWQRRGSENFQKAVEYLEAERRQAESLKAGDVSFFSLFKRLRRYYFERCAPIRCTRGAPLRARRKTSLSLKAIRDIFQNSLDMSSFLEGGTLQIFSSHSSFQIASTSLLHQLHAVHLQEKLEEGSVAVTELLDIRGISSKQIFVLGVTSDAFPVQRGGVLNEAFSELSFRLKQLSGEVDPLFESYYLLSHLLKNNKEVLLTYPLSTESGEVLPASFLAKFPRENLGPPSGALESEDSLQEPVERGVELLEKRNKPAFTEFDGSLGGESPLEKESFPFFPVQRDRGSHYSVTELEMLADCPHRYFFRFLLGLSVSQKRLSEEVPRLLGNIVHKSLELFFPKWFEAHECLGEENFSEASKELLQIARKLFAQSDVDWEAHPSLRQAKEEVLCGLDSAEDGGRRGILKGTLVYQKDVLQTKPAFVEYRFGNDRRAALSLKLEEGQEIFISGSIDRIDKVGEDYTVWDYKTGKAASFRDVENGTSLQVPVYAALIAQQISAGKYPTRGGYFVLSKPNRRDKEVCSPKKGVLVEHLALLPNSRSNELKSALVPKRVQQTLEKIEEIDASVRKGDFHQRLETRSCSHCEYRRICSRNEVLLEQKLGISKKEKSKEIIFPNPKNPEPVSTVKLSLSEEQRIASDIEKSTALVASAGSGKTAVLQTRILALILRGVKVESLLAITFTEKAAREIRARIERAIGEILETHSYENRELSSEERARLVEARAMLAGAQFSTIHSLAARIVGFNPLLAGLWSYERVMTEGDRQELLEETFHESMMKKEFGNRIKNILSFGLSFRTVRDILFFLLERPFSRIQLQNSLDSDTSQFFQSIEHFRKQSLQKVQFELMEFLKPWSEEFYQWMAAVKNVEEKKIELKPEQEELFEVLGASVQRLMNKLGEEESGWEKSAHELLEFLHENRSFQKRKSKKNPRNFWKDLLDAFEEFQFEKLSYDLSFEEQNLFVMQELVTAAHSLNLFFRDQKKKLRVVDFDDLITGAKCALCGEEGAPISWEQQFLLQKLQNQFKHILVDEFQDTDPLQWEIIKSLAGELGEGSARTLFIVGDGKQAIYGFRGGDIRVFDAAREETKRHSGQEVTLSNNYRSNSQVVEFVNTFFNSLLSADFTEEGLPRFRGAVPPQAMVAQQAESESSAVSLLWHKYNSENTRAENSSIGEAGNVARFISQVLRSLAVQDGRWPALEKTNGFPKIAVLTRTAKEVLLIGNALKEEGIPFSISHSAGFYNLEEIVQLENLLHFLASPSDEIRLVGLLRTPLLGLSDRDLLVLVSEIGGNWGKLLQEGEDESELKKEVTETLKSFLSFSAVFSPARVLEEICERQGLPTIYEKRQEVESYQNILRFIDKLRFAEQKQAVLSDPLSALKWLEAVRRDSSGAPSANNIHNPVLVTTVHGAKGLEYPMVILPFLGEKRRRPSEFTIGELGDGKTFMALRLENSKHAYQLEKTFLDSMLIEQNKLRSLAEEKRIFYVATTRAKDYLILSFSEGRKFAEKQSALEELSLLEKQERLQSTETPGEWFQHILSPNDPKNPSEWSFQGGQASLKVPVVRVEATTLPDSHIT